MPQKYKTLAEADAAKCPNSKRTNGSHSWYSGDVYGSSKTLGRYEAICKRCGCIVSEQRDCAVSESPGVATKRTTKGGRTTTTTDMTDSNLSSQGTKDDSPAQPNIATVQVGIRYVCESMQQAFDNGVNSMAVQLLAESLSDKDMLLEGGVLFNFPFDHQKRPVWVIVTGQSPLVTNTTEASSQSAGEGETEAAPVERQRQTKSHEHG